MNKTVDAKKLRELLSECDLEDVAERVTSYYKALKAGGMKRREALYLTEQMHDAMMSWLFPAKDLYE